MIERDRKRDVAQMARNRLQNHSAMTAQARAELEVALSVYSQQSTGANYDHLEGLLNDGSH
jgi:hypothetical protein